MLDGYAWRREQQENLLAYFTVSLMNLEGKYLKEPMTVADLLEPIRGVKREQREEDERIIEEEFREILEREGVM